MSFADLKKEVDRRPGVISRVINGKAFIVNYKTGNVMTLNDLGVVIWEKLPGSLAKIVETIVSEYDVSRAEAQRDVLEFIEMLEQENFVATDPENEKKNVNEKDVEPVQLEKIRELGIQECIPIMAKFELLYQCNLKCIHCANITERWKEDGGEDTGGILKTEEVKHIIDQLYDIGTMLISFTGGEIFARKDIWEIIRYAHGKNFLIELLTNGTLMTEADVEILKNYRVTSVQISIYSHIPAVHDAVTGVPGSYRRSMNLIRCLIANKINTSMVTALMKTNFQDCKKIKQLAHHMGIKHTYLHPIFERDDGSRDVYQLRLTRDKILDFYLENLDEIPDKKRDIDGVICYAGTNQCSISPFGDLSPCFHVILPINPGNLMKRPLKDIWTNSKELDDFRRLNIRHLNGCSQCTVLHHCRICPGLNMRANNNPLEPARVCCDYAFSAAGAVDRANR